MKLIVRYITKYRTVLSDENHWTTSNLNQKRVTPLLSREMNRCTCIPVTPT